MDKFLQTRIDEVALWARNHGYPDVCEWMLTKQTKEKKAGQGKRKQIAYVGKGKRKSEKFFIESELLKDK